METNAGASTLVNRNRISVIDSPPKFMETNIDILQINSRDQILCFLPERLLVYQNGKVGAVSYSNLMLTPETTRFIEDSFIPGDSEIVGHTWRFVNKNGTPDRRFSNNKQLPIMKYGVIRLTSTTGMNLVFNCSNRSVPKKMEEAINSVRKFMSTVNESL